MYFIRDKKSTFMTSGSLPIYRHIIAASYIKLDQMIRALPTTATIIAYHTDAIKVSGVPANYFKQKDQVKVGEFGFEKFSGTLFGKKDVIIKPAYTYANFSYTKISGVPATGGCLVEGAAGCGKTTLLKNIIKEDDIVLSFTNKAINNLRDANICCKNIYTFSMFFNEHLTTREYTKKICKYKSIFVEEYGMIRGEITYIADVPYKDSVFMSTSNGSIWTLVSNGLPIGFMDNRIYALVISGDNIFAASEYFGVFWSSNNGASWTAINTGLTDTINISTLVINGNYIYAGTGNINYTTGSGVWRRPLSDFAVINENTIKNNLSIYPNPTKNNLTIETNNNTEQRIEILNLIGQTVYTSYINKKATINTSAFANGVYILKISSDKETVVRKFIKE